MDETVDINALAFNLLDEETRKEHLIPTMTNPFDLPKDHKMINPFSMKLIGNWTDGEHVIHNPVSCKISRKIAIKGGKVIQAWKINEDNEYVELLKYDDGTWDVELYN